MYVHQDRRRHRHRREHRGVSPAVFGGHGALGSRALAGRVSCPQWLCGLDCVERNWPCWRLISERGLWFFPRFPVTDQAVYKRLHTAGTKPLERLFEQISSVLAERCRGWSRIGWRPSPRTWQDHTVECSLCIPKGDEAGRRVRPETPAVGPPHVSAGPTSARRCWRGTGGRVAGGNTGWQTWGTSASPGSTGHRQGMAEQTEGKDQL